MEPTTRSTGAARLHQGKKTNRTRTGCVTCKNRHVKCDEAKPYCLRCAQSGRKCLGYDPPKAWIFEPHPDTTSSSLGTSSSPSGSASSNASSALIVSPHGGLPLREPEEPRMHQLLQRFLNYTVNSNALYGNRELWTRLLPKLVHTEPALKHLGVALVSITTSHAQAVRLDGARPGPRDNLEYFSLVDRALKRIVGQKDQFNWSLILPCCLLLALCESLRTGTAFPALQHVKAGIRIASTWLEDPTKIPGDALEWQEIAPVCMPLFASLARRASALGAPENLIESASWLQKKRVDMSHVPPTLDDIHTASMCLDAITSFWVIPLMSDESLETFRDPKHVQVLLADFLEKYEQLVDRRMRHTPSPGETARLSILRAGHTAAVIIVSCFPSDTESVFDDVTELFGEIVEIFQRLWKNSLTQPLINSDSVKTPTGRIMPLFLTATRCRDSNIRNQALQLLRAIDCTEAAWNSLVAHRIAETVISLEDSFTPKEKWIMSIPEEARLRLTFAYYDKDGADEIYLGYSRFPHDKPRRYHAAIPLRNREEMEATRSIEWVSRLRIVTTPPFLTDVSPWSIFCRGSAVRESSHP
ncbi:hypothetical protein FH972_024623 [Carpinus fangiana]|uniref:Zn(2)-C6 fungal-type domain-containing protein n=1 Tax=Carpinus fangiana TaxID=176857 RepID=A0A5N6KYI2_9ROSI|nr:hypothetical protein FH972_024623 [Carpinus fangiana]